MSKIIITRDSTQIDAFLTCEQYWQYRFQNLLVPAEEPTAPKSGAKRSDSRLIGKYGHHLLELYYKAIAEGADTTEAAIVAYNHRYDDGEDDEFLPLTPKEKDMVLNRLRDYWTLSLVRPDFQPDSPESVEVGFSELLYEDCDRMYILEGRIDLIGTYQSIHCVADHKFQLREKPLYKKAIQFRNYALVTHTNLLVLNMIRLHQEITNKTFERPIASFIEPEHQWWHHRLIEIYHQMYSDHIKNTYEKRESSCTNKYGYECEYTKLCEEWSLEMIEAKKNAMYRIGEPWTPW